MSGASQVADAGGAPRSARGARTLLAGAIFFVATLGVRWSALDQPPVWDTSTGLFPAAIVLAENGFDLRDLLSRPGWAHGGPNIHPFSSVTWLTALVLHLAPERAVWLPLLHLLHFAITAFALAGVFRLGEALLPPALAVATAFVLLLFPLFQVQAGYLYTEMPLALCTVWAVREAVAGRHVRAAVWSALACSVKEAGIVVPAALITATLVESGPVAARPRRAAALVLPAALFAALHAGVAIPVEHASGVPPLGYGGQLLDIVRKLAMVPDLIALLALGALSLLLASRPAFRALRCGDSAAAESADRTRGLALLACGAFAGFYLVVPLTGVEFYVLPRYYVQVVPLALLACVDLARRLLGARAAAALLAALALFFVANRRGDLGLYPPVPHNEFSLAERSLEYLDLLAVQRRLVDAAAALPAGTPVYYGLPEHFLFDWPRMGYVEAPLAAGRCIWCEPGLRRARLAELPERFVLLYDFPGYGGLELQSLLRQARADPRRHIRRRIFQQGAYRTALFEVTSPGRRGSE